MDKKKYQPILKIDLNKFKSIYLYKCMFSKEKYIKLDYTRCIGIQCDLSDNYSSDNDSEWEKI